jgi:hypothetical protein
MKIVIINQANNENCNSATSILTRYLSAFDYSVSDTGLTSSINEIKDTYGFVLILESKEGKIEQESMDLLQTMPYEDKRFIIPVIINDDDTSPEDSLSKIKETFEEKGYIVPLTQFYLEMNKPDDFHNNTAAQLRVTKCGDAIMRHVKKNF